MVPTQWDAALSERAYQDMILISSPVTLSIDGIDKSLAARPLPREEPAFFFTIDQRTVIVCLSCSATRMLLACVHPACYPTHLSPFLVILTACPYPSDISSFFLHSSQHYEEMLIHVEEKTIIHKKYIEK
jgi:hypothetical protein